MGSPIDISTLTDAERKALHEQLGLALSKSSKRDTYSTAETDLWDVIGNALHVRMPQKKFVESFGRAKYGESAEALDFFLAASCAENVTRTVKLAVMRTVINCVVTHLHNRALPATPTTILNSFGMLDYIVNRNFPGYGQARMLHKVAPLAQAA